MQSILFLMFFVLLMFSQTIEERSTFLHVTVFGDTVQAERGMLRVPENRNVSNKKFIRLPYIHLKSPNQTSRSPLIYLAGGPGSGGLKNLDSHFAPILMQFIHDTDIILFDQRGTGKSKSSLNIDERFQLPHHLSADNPEFIYEMSSQMKSVYESLQDEGIDLSAYNTKENAHDIDDLRKALGLETLTLWGHSYGSHLGLAYLKYHPSSVEKAIFGGVNGLDDRWRYPHEADSLYSTIAQYVQAQPGLAEEIPDFIQLVKQVHQQLKSSSIIVNVSKKEALGYSWRGFWLKRYIELISLFDEDYDVNVGLYDLQVAISLNLGDLNFIKNLPAMYYRMSKDDFSEAALLVLHTLKMRPFGTAMTYSMILASGVSEKRNIQIENEREHGILSDAINFPFNTPEVRNVWKVTDLGIAFRKPIQSDVPVLLFRSDLDGRTTPEAALNVGKSFLNKTEVLVQGASHNLYFNSPEIANKMKTFIRGEQLTSDTLTVPVRFTHPEEQRLQSQIANQLGSKPFTQVKLFVLENREKLGEPILNDLGYQQITAGNTELAIQLFRLNTELFPEGANTHDSLGEGFLIARDYTNAELNYKKSLELNSANTNAYIKLSEIKRLKKK